MSTYPNYHSHKNTWRYSDIYNVGLLFEDFKHQLTKENVQTAKLILEEALTNFYFEDFELHFGNLCLIIESVDNAATTLKELNSVESQF